MRLLVCAFALSSGAAAAFGSDNEEVNQGDYDAAVYVDSVSEVAHAADAASSRNPVRGTREKTSFSFRKSAKVPSDHEDQLLREKSAPPQENAARDYLTGAGSTNKASSVLSAATAKTVEEASEDGAFLEINRVRLGLYAAAKEVPLTQLTPEEEVWTYTSQMTDEEKTQYDEKEQKDRTEFATKIFSIFGFFSVST